MNEKGEETVKVRLKVKVKVKVNSHQPRWRNTWAR